MNTNGVPLSSGEGKRSAEATPDPEVSAKATRRRFTAAYKLSIIEQAGRCETPGEIGQLLRREGLYKPEVMRCPETLRGPRDLPRPHRPITHLTNMRASKAPSSPARRSRTGC